MVDVENDVENDVLCCVLCCVQVYTAITIIHHSLHPTFFIYKIYIIFKFYIINYVNIFKIFIVEEF